MSSQATSALPSACGDGDHFLTKMGTEKNAKWVWKDSKGEETFIVKKKEFTNQCLKQLKEQVQGQVAEAHRQQQTIVGTTAGAGGLACGLGLFPCLVKLISKLKG